MLGTVQFGMDYGVANTHEKTDYDTVKNILSKAGIMKKFHDSKLGK